MRYKTLFIQKLDLIDGTISRADIALSHGDKKMLETVVEQLRDQLTELRSAINVEPDDFEQQFKPQ
jgi:hypothetical protein